MAEIRFAGVQKHFGAVRVVEDLSLTIRDREFFTFVGPSGCGKSTLLSLVAGLEGVSSGTIIFDGTVVNDLAPARRDVAMVFQSYALYPHMTVYENLAFPLRVRKEASSEIEREVKRVASLLGLDSLLHRKPRKLSGGQRQRVALGRAIIRKPKIFLMDEPLSNLDARLRVEMRGELARFHKDYPITTIYVTHDQEEAMVLSDRLAVFYGGRVQQCGIPLEVYEKPANLFVAGFIGNPPMTFLDGPLLEDLSPFASVPQGYDLGRITLGVRPSDVAVTAQREEGAVDADVVLIEPTGSDLWVAGRWRESILKGRAHGETAPTPGSRAFFRVPPSRIHLFDKRSGKRIEV